MKRGTTIPGALGRALPPRTGRRRLMRPANVLTGCLATVLALGALPLHAQPARSAPPTSASGTAPAAPSAAPAAASGAPTAPGAAPAAPAAAPSAVAPTKEVPALPPPSADQVAALEELTREAEAYEAAAKDYRGAITRIVQFHYEDRKRRVLSALDREIGIERTGLNDAREEAIRRLEQFVATYSGANSYPEHTPDAMFRLAALYEERARAVELDITPEELASRLEEAIGLYKRIIREFPNYSEIAGVHYYLGHALNDAARIEEAQQVWRSTVCRDLYPYPVEVDPADPKRDLVKPLVQDHDSRYWSEWEGRHPEPIKRGAAKGWAPQPARPAARQVASDLVDETVFQNPYPIACKPLPQKVRPGEDPRYYGEIWWLIGDYHFNEVSQAGGPFNLNRADAAYGNSLKYKKPPVFGVAMYKRAWTYFKQQRYRDSVGEFIELLRYADAEEKRTGDPGADFRAEAYTYIAGSLTYLDFDGPALDDPYIPRNDVLDTETDPRKAEQKMRIAIERVQDPALIPQTEKWTVEIYRALAQEFRELNQYRNTIELSEIILAKWPNDCGAPVVQNQIAEIYDTLMRQSREGTAEYIEYSQKALEARTKLARYVGADKPWTRACIDDPEAIQTAERLVRGGLRRAAADHTNAGRALVEEALRIGDKSERDVVFERALKEYQLAAQGWEGYLSQDPNAADAYESRFWLADAHHMTVVITVAMDRTPTATQVEIARKTAVDVRDSNEDDKYLQPAAFFVVDSAYQVLRDHHKRFKRTNGAEGFEERDGLVLEGEGTDKVNVVRSPVPQPLLDTVRAREEYVRIVPPAADVMTEFESVKVPQSMAYAYDNANAFFMYGDFAEARKRFEPIYAEQCGKTPFGYKAWERLTTMSNLENDVERSRVLAEAALTKSCAVTEEQKLTEEGIAKPTISRGYYLDAARAYEKAEKMAPGPERDKAWREAAALYKVALEKAPGRDEAPEAAILGANAYKQVGEYDQAIAMYELFIREYGNEEKLAALEKGDPKAEPPVKANPAKYQERVDNLKLAYDELGKAYVLFFSYRQAAETYDTVSRNARFAKDARRSAAKNALVLYSNLGDDDKVLSSRQTLFSLDPPAKERAEVDYLVVLSDLKRWDENGSDEGANRSARLKAMASMEAYYQRNRTNNAAAAYVLQSAYNAAKMHRVGRDGRDKDWCSNTIKAFDGFRASTNEAVGSIEADMAAECAYLAIDEQLKAKFDYDSGFHRYSGVIDKVKIAFDKDMKEANDVWFPKLQAVIETYASPKWSVAARARQGSLYDSCRTGLYNATPPAVKLYTDKEEKLLKLAEESDRDDLLEQADAIRQNRREQWRAARERSLEDADKAMVKFYAESVVWARGYKVRTAAVDHAIRRLAFFTDILGNQKMRDYSQGIVDPGTKQPFVYQDNAFLRSRPGLSAPLAADGLPTPLPVSP